MFDSLAINPQTGKPYDFGSSSGQWQVGDQYQLNTGANYGDSGSGQIDYRKAGTDGISAELMKAAGYNPPAVSSFGYGGVDATPAEAPLSWEDFLKSKGWQLGEQKGTTGQTNQAYQQLFDMNGQPVGNQFQVNQEQDPGHLGLLAGLGMAGGFGAATALGGAGAGSLGASNGSWDVLPSAVGGGAGEAGAGVAGGVPMSGEMDLGAMYGGGEGAMGGSAAPGASLGGEAGGFGGFGDALSGIGSWAQQNPMLTNLGGSALNGLISLYSTNRGLNAQQKATDQANAQLAPYRAVGVQGLNGLSGLLKDPSSITNDPGYQFALTQGKNALDRSAASKGGLYSGAQLKASQRYGQDYASNQYDKAISRYAGAAQLGATGTTNISNNLTNMGNASAGADIYNSNTLQNGINNALGQFNFSQYANKKFPG